MTPLREDFREILRLVRPGARVLDVGCGDGALLELLIREKGVDGQGLELSPAGVSACLARGLAVVQGDADHDLDDFPTRAFDYAVLSDTLQSMRDPKHVLSELLRIAGRAVVSLPNFGHWRVRMSLMFRGRMPETPALPEPWWSTPNIHLCTIADFTDLCRSLDLRIDACAALSAGRPARAIDPSRAVENWRSEQALFLLSRRAEPEPAAVQTDLFGAPVLATVARPRKRRAGDVKIGS